MGGVAKAGGPLTAGDGRRREASGFLGGLGTWDEAVYVTQPQPLRAELAGGWRQRRWGRRVKDAAKQTRVCT